MAKRKRYEEHKTELIEQVEPQEVTPSKTYLIIALNGRITTITAKDDQDLAGQINAFLTSIGIRVRFPQGLIQGGLREVK
jgi:hypothetical protein